MKGLSTASVALSAIAVAVSNAILIISLLSLRKSKKLAKRP
ncbi:MAG: hypothetical protein RSA49_01710 [Anaerovoracaceae bacterium]